MDKVNQVVRSISGRDDEACYSDLRCAVRVMQEYLPERPQMKVIQADVLRRTNKSIKVTTVGKALSRVTEDIWVNGDRAKLELIFGRPLREKPAPRNLVFTLAEYIRETSEDDPKETAWATESGMELVISMARYFKQNKGLIDALLKHASELWGLDDLTAGRQ